MTTLSFNPGSYPGGTRQYILDLANVIDSNPARVSIPRLMLTCGQSFHLFTARHRPVEYGPKGACFRTASEAAITNPTLIYCEGLADSGFFPVWHAWCMSTLDGGIYDPTWPLGTADPNSYFGVCFNRPWLLRYLCNRLTSTYGVFVNPRTARKFCTSPRALHRALYTRPRSRPLPQSTDRDRKQ